MFDRNFFFRELLKQLSPEQQSLAVDNPSDLDTTALTLMEAKGIARKQSQRNEIDREVKRRSKRRSLLDKNTEQIKRVEVQSLLTR